MSIKVNIKNFTSALLIAAFTSSCATIISSNTQNVTLTPSDPDIEAEVLIRNGSNQVNTKIPSVVMLKKDKSPLIVTVKENKCYKRSNTYSKPDYDIIMILGGVPGTITDMSTGAAWKYQDNIYINVDKKNNRHCR